MGNKKSAVIFLLAAITLFAAVSVAVDPSGAAAPSILPAPPTMTYTVASPRMSIVRPPRYQIATDGTRTEFVGTPYGVAENFARKDGELKVAAGVRVIFCLSRGLEGVWYDQTYGRLATSMVLERFVPAVPGTTAAGTTNAGSWVPVGTDKASEVRKGPSITSAKVGVPLLLREPGVYLLRAIVRTEAQPLEPILTIVWPPAVDTDTVVIKVKVVSRPIPEVIPDVEPTPDPDVENIRPLFKEIDANTDSLSADVNGDEIVDIADLMTLSQQWCQEKQIPLTSID